MASKTRPTNLSVPPMVVPTHSLARWIRARLEISDGVLRWDKPLTLLGIVPLGRRRIEVPASEVNSLLVRRAVRPVSLFIGVATMVLPVLFGWVWWTAIITVPLGVWIVLVSLGPRMEAVTATGERHRVSVCFGHQIDADIYMAAVADIAAETQSPIFEDPTTERPR